MADLINREAALDVLKSKPIDDGGVVDDCIMQVLALAKSKINKLPAADAVPVVRCRDCERMSEKDGVHVCSHALPTKSLTQYLVMGTDILAIVQPDDFCSRGKRREENENHT